MSEMCAIIEQKIAKKAKKVVSCELWVVRKRKEKNKRGTDDE